MKILSITTSSSICGVAILENNQLIKEITLNNGLTHSETLMPIIKQILEETYLKLSDINLIAVDIGPGSFTGIRIGIATVKAFADSLGIKTIGVSSLEAISLNSKNSGIVCTLIDAKKENIYSEIFEYLPEQQIIRRNPSFDNITSFLSELKSIDPTYNITFIGDGAIKYKNDILKFFPTSKFIKNNDISAVNVGLYAFALFSIDTFPPIEPLYLRKTDAERNSERNSNLI